MRVLIVLACSLAAGAACGSDAEEATAEGGSGGTSTAGSSSAGQTAASATNGGAAGGAGGGGSDGGHGGGPMEGCLQACVDAHGAGAMLYDLLAVCVYCDACPGACEAERYVDCAGGSSGSFCDDGTCDDCTECATDLPCARPMSGCVEDPDCVDYANCIAPCT